MGRDFLKSVIRDKEGWLGIAQVLFARCQPNLDLFYLICLGQPIRYTNSGGHESKNTILLLELMLGRWVLFCIEFSFQQPTINAIKCLKSLGEG